MTNPPRGGSVSPSTDFGATTLSGRTATNSDGASSDTATESAQTSDRTSDRTSDTTANRTSSPTAATPPSAQTRVDTPTVAPVPGGLGPSPARELDRGGSAAPSAGSAAPGSAPAGAPIRGIRTGRNRGPRRARLQIRHINPMTVLKFSCVLSIALFFVWLIVIGVLFGVLDATGVINNINDTVTQLNGTGSKPPVTAGIVFGGAAIIGVINIVLFIALSTIGAVIYNLCADLVGGVEITLSER